MNPAPLLLSAALLIGGNTLLHAAPYIWIEGEAPAEANFPRPGDGTYAPTAFWEADVLSGGDWLSMKWPDANWQPRATYDFEVPETGRYFFYMRKFGVYGLCRWRIDDGPWQQLTYDNQLLLENTAFQETEQRVKASWVYIDEVDLSTGSHTLTIEPVFDLSNLIIDYCPLAYDVFLFTPDIFFPSGKLKPEEDFALRTTNEFSFEPPVDHFAPCPLDPAPQGDQALPRILAQGDRFVRADNGETLRLVAVNVHLDFISFHASVDYFAKFIAKKGVNVVRFDLAPLFTFHNDPTDGPRFVVNQTKLENLCYAIEQLQAQGIYTALTWNMRNSNGFRDALPEGYRQAYEAGPDANAPGLSPLFLFDPAFADAGRAGWQAVLRSKLCDSQTLAEAPALAFLTIQQQESIFTPDFIPGETISGTALDAIEQAFAQWVATKYGTDTELPTAWQGQQLPEDDLAQQQLGILPPAQWARADQPRSSDTVRFLAQRQRAFYQAQVAWFRNELGYRGLLSTSNKSISHQGALAFINKWSLNVGDYLETQLIIQPYFEGNYGPWVLSENVLFANRSLTNLQPLPGALSQRDNLPLKQITYDDKPIFLSEFTWAQPNRFRTESVLMTAALAAMQGVDGIGYASVYAYHWQGSLPEIRLSAVTPVTIGQLPAIAAAFRRGFIPEASPMAHLQLDIDELFAFPELPLVESIDSQINVPQTPLDAPERAPESDLLWAHGPVRIDFSDTPATIIDIPQPAPTASDLNARGRSVRWDTQRGLFVVDTPMMQAVTGFLHNASPIDLEHLVITSEMDYGCIVVISLDGRPLDFSERILVQVMSEEYNNAWFATGNKVQTIRSIGTAPLMLRHFDGEVVFKRPDADKLHATALDANGHPTILADTGHVLHLLPASLYYLIEKY